jgi:hypothetical protein
VVELLLQLLSHQLLTLLVLQSSGLLLELGLTLLLGLPSACLGLGGSFLLSISSHEVVVLNQYLLHQLVEVGVVHMDLLGLSFFLPPHSLLDDGLLSVFVVGTFIPLMLGPKGVVG